jgi:OmpA-OmpF porin, OOP family
MKCNPIRWLWGVLPVAALAFLATHWERPGIEADIGTRIAERLKSGGVTWAKIDLSGRDAVITGRATDEDDQRRARDLSASVWGVRNLANQTDLIERADSYAWWVSKSGRRLVLRGLVPNEATRATVIGLARAQAPDGEVVDEMRLARGVPNRDVWLSGVTFALTQIGGLKSGEARLDNVSLAVNGEANTAATYRAIRAALQSDVPRGVSLRDERVTPPTIAPFVWSARATANEIVLSGHVPDERTRALLINQIRTAFSRNPRVTDRTELGGGAPQAFAAAAQTSLKELARLEDGTSTVRDTTLSVEGMAADEQTATAVRRDLRGAVPQGYRMSEQIRFREAAPPPPPPAPVAISPYTGGAEVIDNRVILTGHVPSPAAQATLVQAARTRFPSRQIDDRLNVGSGAPDGWQRCFDGAFLGLARLGSGRATLVDRRLDIVARTNDEGLAAAVPNDVRSSVQGACDANVRIDLVPVPEPDWSWRATFDGATVVLSGDVSSQTARQTLLQNARQRFSGTVRVVDDMRVVEHPSRQWPRAAETGLTALSQLTRGEAVLERQQLVVTGEAQFEQGLPERVREQMTRALPNGYQGRERISMVRPQLPPAAQPQAPPPPAAAPARQLTTEADQCQTRLREALRNGVINFERAKANLTSDSTQTLDRIAQIVRQCPRVRIEIEGHTDAEGTPERNQRLSDRRANSVQQYLARAGVDNAMLSSNGYGETRPIAPNDTADNRARNRRIEFTVSE